MLGLHPKIFFGKIDPKTWDKYDKVDFYLNRRNVAKGPQFKSYSNLPGFKIISEDNLN